MTSPLVEGILNQLRGGSLQQISSQLGASPQQAENAIGAALPLLLGALGRNAQQPGGAQALFGALLRDHGGAAAPASAGSSASAGGLDIGGLLGSLLGGGSVAGAARQLNGEGILQHIFGNRLPQAENQLGQASGLDAAGIHKLLVLLAPIVLGYLGRQVAQGQASSADGLGSLLGQERRQIEQQGGAGGLLAAVLDQDGDGKLGVGDLLKLGAGFLNRR